VLADFYLKPVLLIFEFRFWIFDFKKSEIDNSSIVSLVHAAGMIRDAVAGQDREVVLCWVIICIFYPLPRTPLPGNPYDFLYKRNIKTSLKFLITGFRAFFPPELPKKKKG
jgi:hypothetical protein